MVRDGTGVRNDAHRYWLKGQEEKWKADDPLWELRELNERTLRDLQDDIRGVPRTRREGKG